MCRNITPLRGLEPPATEEEVRAAAVQFVRKVSGIARPTGMSFAQCEQAADQITAIVERLLEVLPPRARPPKTLPPLRRPEVIARIAARSDASAR